jgi:heme/copper-type cytochrome/quinol oxidase subunit 1
MYNFNHSIKLPITPWLRDSAGFWYPVVFDFEKNFLDKTIRNAMLKQIRTWWWLTIVLAIIYVCFIFYGRYLMQNRTRYEARKALISWNIILAFLSIVGTIRCLPGVFYIFKNESLEKTLCDRNFSESIIEIW